MTYLELLGELSRYTNNIDIDKFAACYKTVTFTENSDGSFLLDSPYAIRMDKEVN